MSSNVPAPITKTLEGGFVVAAEVIADGFGIASADVQGLMHSTAITSRCETGAGEDEGRWRLTFYHEGRAFRLIVDENAQILGQSSFTAPRQRSGAA